MTDKTGARAQAQELQVPRYDARFTPQVRAFLDLIAWKEVPHSLQPTAYQENNGTRGSTGRFTDADVAAGGGFPESAGKHHNVGRYQMNRGDWLDAKKADPSITGYSAADQDKLAVWKLGYRHVLDALERGDLHAAIHNAGKEWASLPGSPYGQVQHGYTEAQAIAYYAQRLKVYQAFDRGETPQQSDREAATTARAPHATLRHGDDGGQVRELQQALSALGYGDAQGRALSIDGRFGPATQHALERFQAAHALAVDGVAGARTRAALAAAATHPLASETGHPQHALYAAIARHLPQGTSPAVIAAATAAARENGITGPERLAEVAVRGSDAFITGVQPGERVRVDLQAPVADLQRTSDYLARTASAPTAPAIEAHTIAPARTQ